MGTQALRDSRAGTAAADLGRGCSGCESVLGAVERRFSGPDDDSTKAVFAQIGDAAGRALIATDGGGGLWVN